MKKFILLLSIVANALLLTAQMGAEAPKDTTWKSLYRASNTRVNNLVHTKLECKFDYSKSWLLGKVWITLQPHFYKTDSLTLDAKGMQLNEVALMNGTTKQKLNYKYNGNQIKINLGKTFKATEKYTIYIDYISKPDEVETVASAAITDTKGLYFINPRGEDGNKPQQIWTQGESEATSVWCPTIESTNQKTTNEFYLTVPAKYVTLSNGLKISEKKNTDGTRTDYWKMDLPHAPYLFFIGVGDFTIIKDAPYNGKEVSYYVEKDQAPFAKGVFGNTGEMMKFFSTKLGVEYPWQKYSQIVGRDYVSGAMENTTATLHQESAYQNNRELADGNSWEQTIAHELFHQWFGDLVTAESWSNLTLNESFANYSEYLWEEYKYGKDAADEHHYQDMQGYLFGGNEKKNLVRYNYSSEMDMFDGVSYNKGGRILHMLRKYVGDEAFFKSLNLYLTTNKFKAGEAAQLRLAFEEVTGMDLNWYWNQWYYGSGHPKLEMSNTYNEATKQIEVTVNQTQKSEKIFRLPLDIDVYSNGTKTRTTVWTSKLNETFYINAPSKPQLVDVDGDRVLLAERKETKTTDEYLVQYKNNKNFIAKKEAIDYFAKNKLPELALGLTDNFEGLRNLTLSKINGLTDRTSFIAAVEKLAATEKDNKTKATALKILGKEKNEKYKALFTQNVNDISYSLAGAALEGLASLNPTEAYTMAKKYTADAKGALGASVTKLITDKADESDFDYLAAKIEKGGLSQQTFNALTGFAGYLAKIKNSTLVKKGIDVILGFKNKIPASFQEMIAPQIKAMLTPIGKAQGAEIETYIADKLK